LKKLLLVGAVCALLITNNVFAQSTDPRVTQANIDQTICVPGYTDKVRPTTQYTNRIKSRQFNALAGNLPAGAKITDYKEDHIINLGIGGSPYDVNNLRLEPNAESYSKDVVERRMQKFVCAKPAKITLAKAQECMAKDWRKCPTK
jgi:hypothetical protein